MTLAETHKTIIDVGADGAANGRFFDAQETDEMYLDVSCLRQLSQQVLDFAGLIRQDRSRVNPIFLEGFNSVVDDLTEQLNIEDGALQIISTKPPVAPKPKLDTLIREYGVEEGAFLVPAAKLTAARVLPYPDVDYDYYPAVNLRIQTSVDKPISVFGAPGEVEELPSSGSWFRFDLGSVALSHFVKLKSS